MFKLCNVSKLWRHVAVIVVLKYYATEDLKYYTKTYAALSCITKELEYYTVVSKYYTTKAPEFYTTNCAPPNLLHRGTQVFSKLLPVLLSRQSSLVRNHG